MLKIALLLLFSTLPVAGDNWPHWGGPNTDFKLSDPGAIPDEPFALRIAWRRAIGTGYSAVSVAGGLAVTLYSDGTNDYVIALDASNGTEKWRYTIGPAYLGHWGSQNGPLSTPLLTENAVIGLSPRGRLFSLDLSAGVQRWSIDLVENLDARTPFWGFTSSPRLLNGRVVLQTGGRNEAAISAFQPDTGERIWSAVADSVDYQTHGVFKIGLEEHLVFHGIEQLVGLNPATGEELWSYNHGGGNSASSTSSHPVEISEGNYFVKNSGRGGVLVQVSERDGRYVASEIWRTSNIRGTYMYPIHHDGLLFGYSGRILNALDASTGERVWRSREPGDGLPLIIDDHLVTITKDGKLAIAPVSKEGYRESASLQVFEDIVWSPASYAAGKFYVRSMSEIACVEIVTEDEASTTASANRGRIPNTAFAAFVDRLGASTDKAQAIDQLLSENPQFPVIEGDSLAHFVYIGKADEVAITGDHIGRRIDVPMHRVYGTDLFYYSTRLTPDARITYRFTVDLQKNLTDPRNPNTINSLHFGKASYFGMPQWKEPDHITLTPAQTGEVTSLTFVTSAGDSHNVSVYLPPGYAGGDSRLPVVYLHDVRRPFRSGLLDRSLDNLITQGTIPPVIAVIVPAFARGGYNAYVGVSKREQYLKTFTDELIPYLDKQFRTDPSRSARANYGTSRGGFMATFASLRHPDLFGAFAVQSTYWDQTNESEKNVVIPASDTRPSYRIYLDWGRYDARSPIEGNDTRKQTELFSKALRDRGYTYTGGMVNDGAGWASWRNRFDRVFGTLFPPER